VPKKVKTGSGTKQAMISGGIGRWKTRSILFFVMLAISIKKLARSEILKKEISANVLYGQRLNKFDAGKSSTNYSFIIQK
jgi:hypothetical protein